MRTDKTKYLQLLMDLLHIIAVVILVVAGVVIYINKRKNG
jgi:Na+/serine symporter